MDTADDEVVEPQPTRARHGQHQAQQSECNNELRAGVVGRIDATGVHQDPGAHHVQRHQDANRKDRQAQDHRDAANELEQHVRGPRDRR